MESEDVTASSGYFAWYELATTDFATARKFYSGVVDWEALDAPLPDTAYALFAAGTVPAAGLMAIRTNTTAPDARSEWLGYVIVDDVDGVTERARRLGGIIRVPPAEVPGVSRYSIIEDPQGARIALLRWLNPSQESGGLKGRGHVCWHELFAADWQKAFAFYRELLGWEDGGAHVGELGTYQLFSVGGRTIGGILTKPPEMTFASWLYYFDVRDIDAAAQRVRGGGGRVLDGPIELPEHSRIVRCADPQGAVFGLEGIMGVRPAGHFARTSSPAKGAR